MAWGIPALIKREDIRIKILFPAGIIFLAVLSFLCWKQCGYWKNHIVLFSHTLEVTQDNALAHNSIGLFLDKEGENEEALKHLNEAIRIVPTYTGAYVNRGNYYDKIGRYQQAINDFNEATRLKPHFAIPYYNRGNTYRKLGQYQLAIRDYTEAVNQKSDYAEAYRNRAGVYLAQGSVALGCLDARKACKLGLCQALLWAQNERICR
jgi:tetratricopeptide (TPR) repeat protein